MPIEISPPLLTVCTGAHTEDNSLLLHHVCETNIDRSSQTSVKSALASLDL